MARKSREQNVLSNPIARAANRARMERWLAKRLAQIDGFTHGDECAEFLSASLDEMAVCLKAMEGFEAEDWVLEALLNAVDATRAMAGNGGRWDSEHAKIMRSALTYAVSINCKMPFERIAIGSEWTRRAVELSQALEVQNEVR